MSNNDKNIYYTSNSFQTDYPENCRSSFINRIDEHEFHYINNQNIKIGLKEITFENQSSLIEGEDTSDSKSNLHIVYDSYKRFLTIHYT